MSSQTAALSSPLQRLLLLDERTFLRVRAFERPTLTPLMRLLTRMGNTGGWMLHGLLIAWVAPAVGLRLGVAIAIATCVVQVLKRTCRRARPSRGIAGFAALAHDPDAFSFPSGHTAVACAAAVAVMASWHGLGGVELGLALGIATSRVYLGAHYPLDVMVGAILGVLSGLAAISLTLA